MRYALIASLVTLLAVLWLGRTPRDPFRSPHPPAPGDLARSVGLDCHLATANAMACGQTYCEEGLIRRGLLPAHVVIENWESHAAERADHLRVSVYTGRFTAANQSHYVQCEMVGRVVMAARVLAAGQVPEVSR